MRESTKEGRLIELGWESERKEDGDSLLEETLLALSEDPVGVSNMKNEK